MPLLSRRAAPARATARAYAQDPQRVMRAFLETLARLATRAAREAAR